MHHSILGSRFYEVTKGRTLKFRLAPAGAVYPSPICDEKW